MKPRNLQRVLIRTDCSPEIGIGHAMRCLALGAAMRDANVSLTFVMADCLADIAGRYASEGFSIQKSFQKSGSLADAKETARSAREFSADLVVLDGYQFGASFHREVGRAGLLAVFDDAGEGADIVIAPTPPVQPELYGTSLASSRRLLGPDYLLLRPEFMRWNNWQRSIPERARRIMVAVGGTDPLNMTGKTLQALDPLPDELEIIVATAVEDDQYAALRAQAENAVHNARVERRVSDMAALMAWADVAVIGGGTTLWEAAFMGLPSVALIVADNQARGSAFFERNGCGIALDVRVSLDLDHLTGTMATLIADVERRHGCQKQGRRLVDGKGAQRLVAALDAIVAEDSATQRSSRAVPTIKRR